MKQMSKSSSRDVTRVKDPVNNEEFFIVDFFFVVIFFCAVFCNLFLIFWSASMNVVFKYDLFHPQVASQ